MAATGLRSSPGDGEVSSGDARLDLAAVPDDVTVSAGSGDVVLQLPPGGAPYRVEAESSSGRRRVDVPTDLASPRSVSVTVSSGDLEIRPR